MVLMKDTHNFKNKFEFWKTGLIKLIKNLMLQFLKTKSFENQLILFDENE